MKVQKVIPGKGTEDILLGLLQADVESQLGAPEDVDIDDEVAGEKNISWSYDDDRISLNFDEDDGYRLGIIEIWEGEVILFDEEISKFTHDQIRDLLKRNEVTDVEEGTLTEEKYIAIDPLGLTIYFENSMYGSIQITPPLNDDDSYQWPEQ
ncbi:MAG: hypothetical protein OCD76_09385 [Reichenbachiella sp.]